MLAITHARICSSIKADPVLIEVHSSAGVPSFALVGMAETAVKESRERVRSAIVNAGFEFPWRHLVVNLSPADIPKTGSGYDLAIAIGLLMVSGQLSLANSDTFEFYGELGLSGQLNAVAGLLPALIKGRDAGKTLIIPSSNQADAAWIADANVYLANSLHDVVSFLKQNKSLMQAEPLAPEPLKPIVDWQDVKGQLDVKQSLLYAAAGGHSALMIGPPGCGKTMLVKAFMSILPPLSESQSLDSAVIHSIAQQPTQTLNQRIPPMRSPHHTCSEIAIIGGGSKALPGEVSLAHNGVLFLDELLEFSRAALEGLREPLENGEIHITRARAKAVYPAKFQLLCAMNPCPCGHYGHPRCQCSPEVVKRYMSKLSGPLLDRIDLHIEVQPISPSTLLNNNCPMEPNSHDWRQRIAKCHYTQYQRQGKLNSQLNPRELESLKFIQPKVQKHLLAAIEQLGLSARALHRIMRLLITIADWHQMPIDNSLVAEAISLRSLDRSP